MPKSDEQVLSEIAELLDAGITPEMLGEIREKCAAGADPAAIADDIRKST